LTGPVGLPAPWAVTLPQAVPDSIDMDGKPTAVSCCHFLRDGGAVQVFVQGPEHAIKDLVELVHRGEEERNKRLRALAAGEFGYYIVFLTAKGHNFVHISLPTPIEHFGHIAGVARTLARDLGEPHVIILDWRELQAAPLVAPITGGNKLGQA
jgi:hypothetical protein